MKILLELLLGTGIVESLPTILSVSIFFLLAWIIHEYKILSGSPKNPAFQKRIKILRNNSPHDTYLSSLRNLIERINGVLRDKPKETNESSNAFLHKYIGVQPWTAKSFGFMLNLAMLYPVVFLLIGWLIFNYGKLGSLEVLPTITNKYTIVAFCERAGILALLSFGAFSFYKGSRTNNGWKSSLAWYTIAFAFTIAGADAFAVTGAFTAFAITGAFAVASANAFAVAGADAFADAFAAIAVTIAAAGTNAFAVAGAFAVAFAFAFGFGFTVAGAFVWACYKYYSSLKNKAFFWFSSWFILLAYLLCAVYLSVHFGKSEFNNNSLIIIIFLGILPLFNAPLDWLSFGFTRGLLQVIADKKHSIKGIIFMLILDLIIAIIFLISVTVSSLLGIFLVNYVSGVEVINLFDIFAQLRSGEWNKNLWIWAMLGSTLIPTLVHFYLVIYALLVFFFTSERLKEAADQLQLSIDNPDIPPDSDAVLVALFAILLRKFIAGVIAFFATIYILYEYYVHLLSISIFLM